MANSSDPDDQTMNKSQSLPALPTRVYHDVYDDIEFDESDDDGKFHRSHPPTATAIPTTPSSSSAKAAAGAGIGQPVFSRQQQNSNQSHDGKSPEVLQLPQIQTKNNTT
jgi:hypothetical protein